MGRNYHYYRSELKSKSIKRYKFIGIASELILSTELFTKNENLIPFLNKVFGLNFRPYVFRSRTLIVARTTREIYIMNDKEYDHSRRNLLEFVLNILDTKDIKIIGKEKGSFTKWMEGLLNE